MPHTPPINLEKLKKTGLLSEGRFFNELAQECSYVDPEAAKSFFMGLVRHMTKELRTHGVVRLPHLGDFAMVKQKPTSALTGKYRSRIEGKYLLKFYAKGTWREYFSKLSEKPGKEGKLDPREKILNQEL